jgi:hypothetical protein
MCSEKPVQSQETLEHALLSPLVSILAVGFIYITGCNKQKAQLKPEWYKL